MHLLYAFTIFTIVIVFVWVLMHLLVCAHACVGVGVPLLAWCLLVYFVHACIFMNLFFIAFACVHLFKLPPWFSVTLSIWHDAHL